jgi:hypothetical protein
LAREFNTERHGAFFMFGIGWPGRDEVVPRDHAL